MFPVTHQKKLEIGTMKGRLKAVILEESSDAKSQSNPGVHHILERDHVSQQ